MLEVVLHDVRVVVASACLLGALIGAGRLLEISCPVEPDQPPRKAWLDYQLVAVCLLIPLAFSSITAFTSGALVSAFGGGLIRLRSDGAAFYVSLAIFVVAYDLFKYWTHRLSHIVPVLWRIHSFHHSAESLTYVTGVRHHWLDAVINKGFLPLFPILFRTPSDIVLIGGFIGFLPDACAHLNVRLPLGRCVMWLNNPQYHRIHHSCRPEHLDKNFASIFPIWDIVFGTAWRPAPDEFPATGLPDGDTPRDLWDGVVWPFRGLARERSVGVLD